VSLKAKIESLVSDIPPGRVMTYGDIAACIGRPGAGRLVGLVAATGNPALPWHRVVNAVGRLAPGYREQADELAAEGVPCQGDRVANFRQHRWLPTFSSEPDLGKSPSPQATASRGRVSSSSQPRKAD